MQNLRLLLGAKTPALSKPSESRHTVASFIDFKMRFKPQIRLGATIRLRDESDQEHVFTLVSEDAACVAKGLIGPVSPLANSLLGKTHGDTVFWVNPSGVTKLEVLDVTFSTVETNMD